MNSAPMPPQAEAPTVDAELQLEPEDRLREDGKRTALRQHIVIRARGDLLAGPSETPELSIFVQQNAIFFRNIQRPTPWGHIAPGERLWVMVNGAIVATAVVDRFLEIEDCSASELREVTVGHQLHDLEAYWHRFTGRGMFGRLSGVVVWTRDERRLARPFKPLAGGAWKRREALDALGSSWVVIDRPELAAKWLSGPEVEPSSAAETGAARSGPEPTHATGMVTSVWGVIILLGGCLVVLLVVLVGLFLLARLIFDPYFR